MKSGIYRRAFRVRAARISPAASSRVSQRSRDSAAFRQWHQNGSGDAAVLVRVVDRRSQHSKFTPHGAGRAPALLGVAGAGVRCHVGERCCPRRSAVRASTA